MLAAVASYFSGPTPGGASAALKSDVEGQLLFTDATGQQQKTVTVKAKAGPGSGGATPPAGMGGSRPPGQPPSRTATEFEGTLSKDKLLAIQSKLGIADEIDAASIKPGQVDQITRAAIKDFQRERRIPSADGTLTPELVDEILKLEPQVPGARNAYERTELTPGKVQQLQRALNVPVDPSGALDKATRAAIANFIPTAPVADRPTNSKLLSPGLFAAIVGAK